MHAKKSSSNLGVTAALNKAPSLVHVDFFSFYVAVLWTVKPCVVCLLVKSARSLLFVLAYVKGLLAGQVGFSPEPVTCSKHGLIMCKSTCWLSAV